MSRRASTFAVSPVTGHRMSTAGTSGVYLTRSIGLSIVLVVMTTLMGCGTSSVESDADARKLFLHGQFDAAVQAVDRALAETVEPEARAELYLLKGRCYWERTGENPQSDGTLDMAQQALDSLQAALAEHEIPEAHHFRAMIFRRLGDDENADQEHLAWLNSDDQYTSAYLNQGADPPAIVFRDPPSGRNNGDETGGDLQPSPSEDESDRSDEGPVESRPWSRPAGDDESLDVSPLRQPSTTGRVVGGDRKPNDSLTRPAAPSFGGPGFGSTTSAPEDESDAPDGPGELADTGPSDGTTSTPEPETTAPVNRLPGSTWSPLPTDPPAYGSGALPNQMPSSSTGLVGPNPGGLGTNPTFGQPANRLGAAPSTGLVGPPNTSPLGGFTANQLGPAPPTTGISGRFPGYADLPGPSGGIGNVPSGLPGASGVAGQSGLPPEWQPTTPNLPAARRQFPQQGPTYSPLIPTPLTGPTASFPGLAPNGFTPNTSPLSQGQLGRPSPLSSPSSYSGPNSSWTPSFVPVIE